MGRQHDGVASGTSMASVRAVRIPLEQWQTCCQRPQASWEPQHDRFAPHPCGAEATAPSGSTMPPAIALPLIQTCTACSRTRSVRVYMRAIQGRGDG